MLITFSSRILARFHTGPPEILADGNFAFRPDLSKILTARGFVSRRESRQHSHRDIWLLAKNPGKTPPGILPRFWPLGISSPAKNPGKIPAEILAAGNPVSRQESRQDSRRDSAEILAAGNPASLRDLGKIPSRSRYHFYKGGLTEIEMKLIAFGKYVSHHWFDLRPKLTSISLILQCN